MQQLIKQLTAKYGISAEQATGIMETVKEYAETKFPGLGNSLNSILGNNTSDSPQQKNAIKPDQKEEGILEKTTHFVEDHIPGGLKEKAEEMLGGAGNKLKGIFS